MLNVISCLPVITTESTRKWFERDSTTVFSLPHLVTFVHVPRGVMPATVDRLSFSVYLALTEYFPWIITVKPRYFLAMYVKFLSSLSAVRRVNPVHNQLYY